MTRKKRPTPREKVTARLAELGYHVGWYVDTTGSWRKEDVHRWEAYVSKDPEQAKNWRTSNGLWIHICSWHTFTDLAHSDFDLEEDDQPLTFDVIPKDIKK